MWKVINIIEIYWRFLYRKLLLVSHLHLNVNIRRPGSSSLSIASASQAEGDRFDPQERHLTLIIIDLLLMVPFPYKQCLLLASIWRKTAMKPFYYFIFKQRKKDECRSYKGTVPAILARSQRKMRTLATFCASPPLPLPHCSRRQGTLNSCRVSHCTPRLWG